MKPYYSADGITLYQGDNREVLAAIGLKPEDVALLWGDPPYGVLAVQKRNGRRAGDGANRGTVQRVWRDVVGDDKSFDPTPWLVYSRAVFWGANHYATPLPTSAAWWVWHKRPGMADGVDFADAELAWTNLPGQVRVFAHAWMGVVRPSENGRRMLHPTQKPVALAAWGFRQAKLKPGDLVLSPWLGSGPEAVAARDMGLRFIGIELVAEYLDACANRLRQAPLPLVAPAPEPEQVGLGLSLDSQPAKR